LIKLGIGLAIQTWDMISFTKLLTNLIKLGIRLALQTSVVQLGNRISIVNRLDYRLGNRIIKLYQAAPKLD
jgi:hypothetical protein